MSEENTATTTSCEEPALPSQAMGELSAANINYVNYQSEAQMPDIMQLIKKDLSEPYSVYTYRYFINNWSKLCFLVSIERASEMLQHSATPSRTAPKLTNSPSCPTNRPTMGPSVLLPLFVSLTLATNATVWSRPSIKPVT